MQQTPLEQAFFENRQDIITFLKSRLHCPAAADDLCQDIYLRLQRVEDTDGIENCRGYLFMMAANLAADSLRRIIRHQILVSHDPEIAWPLTENQTPEDILFARAEIDHLNRAVSELPQLSRKIFNANRFDNKTQRQIAQEFGLSLSAVEYHIRKVLDHLASARHAFHQPA
jgi:RNA polymerase sigma factor (sigma-70 family)